MCEREHEWIRIANMEVVYQNKNLLLNESSQLIRGCSNIKLTFQDIWHQLHVKVNAEFKLT